MEISGSLGSELPDQTKKAPLRVADLVGRCDLDDGLRQEERGENVPDMGQTHVSPVRQGRRAGRGQAAFRLDPRRVSRQGLSHDTSRTACFLS